MRLLRINGRALPADPSEKPVDCGSCSRINGHAKTGFSRINGHGVTHKRSRSYIDPVLDLYESCSKSFASCGQPSADAQATRSRHQCF